MRELVVENQEVLLIPQNFKFANKGKVKEVRAGDFTLEADGFYKKFPICAAEDCARFLAACSRKMMRQMQACKDSI